MGAEKLVVQWRKEMLGAKALNVQVDWKARPLYAYTDWIFLAPQANVEADRVQSWWFVE
jgi:hypothetical protein